MKKIIVVLMLLICSSPLQSAQKSEKHKKLYVPKAFEKEVPAEKAIAAQALLELYQTAQKRSRNSPLMLSLNQLLASSQKGTVTTAATLQPLIL